MTFDSKLLLIMRQLSEMNEMIQKLNDTMSRMQDTLESVLCAKQDADNLYSRKDQD